MAEQLRKDSDDSNLDISRIFGQPSLTQAIINNARAGVYLSQNHKFVYVNPFLEALTGYTSQELTGKNCLDYIHPDDRDIVRIKAIQTLKHSGTDYPSYEYRCLTKNSNVIWLIESISSTQYRERRAVLGIFMNITRRKSMEEMLVTHGERYRHIIEHLQDAYFEIDLEGNFTYVNPAACEGLCYSREELIGQNYRMVVPEMELNDAFLAINSIYKKGTPDKSLTQIIRRKNGELFRAETAIALRKDSDGKAIGFSCLGRDITERKSLEQDLLKSEEKYRSILKEMEDGYYEVDLSGNFTFVNRAWCQDLRYTTGELIGMNYSKIVPEEDALNIFRNFNRVYRSGEPNRNLSYRVLRKDGTIGYTEASVSLSRDTNGNVTGFRCVNRDVTERVKLEQKLSEMATHDFLTGLPNRILLNDRFHIDTAHTHRNGKRLAIMSLDLDQFKAINDTMGHSVGDELLKMVAIRLSCTLRSADTVARIGGDEFVLLLPEISGLEDASAIAQKLVDSFRGPIIVEGNYPCISCSIGLSLFPDDGSDLDILMRKSDAAMYHAKKEGGNRYKIYSESDRLELSS